MNKHPNVIPYKSLEEQNISNISNIKKNYKWDIPIMFENFNLSEIPYEILPYPFSSFASALSENLEISVSASVLSIIGTLSTVFGKKFVVKVNDSYYETTNLYILIALPPGNRKSPLLKKCLKPLKFYEEEQKKKLAPEIRKATSICETKKQEIDYLKSTLRKNNKDNSLHGQIADLENELSEIVIPKNPILFLNNTTPESLVEILIEQGEKIGVLSDEGGIFETLSGLYFKGKANIDVILQGWDAGDVRTKRKSVFTMLNPLINMTLIVQPIIIDQISKNKVFAGRGLIERFLYCIPKSYVGYRTNNTKEIPEDIIEKYNNAVLNFLNIPDTENPVALELSTKASELHSNFTKNLELKLREDRELSHCKGWGSKLSGHALRLAGILHLAENGNNSLKIQIGTMKNAISLSEILMQHAIAVFEGFNFDKKHRNAKIIWEYIYHKKYEQFNQGDLTRDLKNKLKADDIKYAIPILIGRNLISEPISYMNSKIITYLVNPGALSRNITDITDNLKKEDIKYELEERAGIMENNTYEALRDIANIRKNELANHISEMEDGRKKLEIYL